MAGHSAIPAVVELVGVPEPTYRGAESGKRNASKKLIDGAATAFNVTQDYLLHGTVTSAGDRKAAHLCNFMKRLPEVLRSSSRSAEWLQQCRKAKGYRSATAAAKAFGWAVSSYIGHENGTRPVPWDKMATYAMRFDLGLARIMDGHPVDDRQDVPSTDNTGPEWPKISSYSSVLPARSLDDFSSFWKVLQETSRVVGSMITAPFLDMAPAGNALRWEQRIWLPARMVRSRAIFEKRQAFCVDLRFSSSSDPVMMILQRSCGEVGEAVVVFDGIRIRHATEDEHWIEGDPSDPRAASGAPLILGVVRGQITIDA